MYFHTHIFPFSLLTLGTFPYVVTTQCVVSELEGLGGQLTGAMYVAKRFQLRNCGHHRDAKSATDCVQSMIGTCLFFWTVRI